MNLNLPICFNDPKDGKPSVSLTNLVISITYLVVMGVLQALGKVQDSGMAMEYFGISSALYFGRRVQFKGKTYDTNINEEEKEETK
jgi:hypothetical protein